MAEMFLMVIAAVVCVLQARKMSAWGWIVLYWAVLTVKNMIEFGGAL